MGLLLLNKKSKKKYDRWNGVDWQKGQKKKTMTLTSITKNLSNQNPYKPNDLGEQRFIKNI